MDTPERPFDREDPFTWPSATEEDLATFTPEERAAFDAVMGNRSDELPPGPWAWREVTPFSAASPYAGQALVAADGSWVAWSESGYGTVETSHPAVKDLFARSWELAAAPALPRLLDADLNQEDDDGNGWTLVELDLFDPSWLFPGALVDAGREGGHGPVTVLRTELFETTGGRTVVLVTFDKVD